MMKKTLLTFILLASAAHASSADFPSSKGLFQGDHLRMTSDVYGLVPTSTAVTGQRCAGKNSTYTIDKISEKETFITFFYVSKPLSEDTCPEGAALAKEASQYKLPNDTYQTVGYKSTGVAFGALIVPFKFRLGNDKKLVSSATIAPYLGARWSRLQGFGVEFVPVVSAGLGLVPVTDPSSNTTETKAAFSTAVGLTLSSSKNADFSAGILLGKDFLSKTERGLDPSVNKPWISIWVGISQ